MNDFALTEGSHFQVSYAKRREFNSFRALRKPNETEVGQFVNLVKESMALPLQYYQIMALMWGVRKSAAIFTGKPGTGKTFIIAALVSYFLARNQISQHFQSWITVLCLSMLSVL